MRNLRNVLVLAMVLVIALAGVAYASPGAGDRSGTDPLQAAVQADSGLSQPAKDKVAELKTIRSQVKDLDSQLRTLRKEAATTWKELIGGRNAAKAEAQKARGARRQYQATIKTVRTAMAPMADLRSKLQTTATALREAEKKVAADRREAVKAIKAKDAAAAMTALDQAITDAKEVVAQKTTSLDLEKQAGTILKNAVDALKTQTTAPSTQTQ